jgi:glyoxylase-like metal-dependent hydrolase (beta-lactamase superfamily II)
MTSDIEAPSLRLYILNTGYLDATAAPFILQNDEVELVTTSWFSGCYLLQHPRGWFLWDTGLPDSLIGTPSGINYGAFRFVVTKTLISYLHDLGLTPQDITYLGFSHLHPDHVGNIARFTASTLFIHGREYADALGRPSPEWFAPDEQREMGLEQSQIMEIWGNYDVFGDGSVLILEAPGHTVGHQVLLVQLPKTGRVLLSGDLYYSTIDRAEKRVAHWNYSRQQSLDSMEHIEKVIGDTHALLIIHHDQEQHAALPHSPAYLE